MPRGVYQRKKRSDAPSTETVAKASKPVIKRGRRPKTMDELVQTVAEPTPVVEAGYPGTAWVMHEIRLNLTVLGDLVQKVSPCLSDCGFLLREIAESVQVLKRLRQDMAGESKQEVVSATATASGNGTATTNIPMPSVPIQLTITQS